MRRGRPGSSGRALGHRGVDPETIRPKRAYRRNRYFARNELSRLCLGVLRTAAGEPLSTDEIAARVIAAKGFDLADSVLRVAIREQVGSTVKRLHRDGPIENMGAGRASKWKLAGRTRWNWRHRQRAGPPVGSPTLR